MFQALTYGYLTAVLYFFNTFNVQQHVRDVMTTKLPIVDTTNYLALSQELLYDARTFEDCREHLIQLKNASPEQLKTQLADDAKRKAFWINLYNAHVQLSLQIDSTQYQHKSRYFGIKQVAVAGYALSLDDIEHGVLRCSKVKLSLGYLSKWFPSKFEREFKVEKLDWRIHFALNCGAKSCPPIAFYKAEIIDKQLDWATASYLKQECVYDTNTNTVWIPKLFLWFQADFGGRAGIRQILMDEQVIPEGKRPKLRFKEYDFSLELDNFADSQ